MTTKINIEVSESQSVVYGDSDFSVKRYQVLKSGLSELNPSDRGYSPTIRCNEDAAAAIIPDYTHIHRASTPLSRTRTQ